MSWLICLLCLAIPFMVLGAVVGEPRAGKGGRISVGGLNLVLQNWQGTDNVEDLDCTNFEGSGYAEHLDGIRSCDFSCAGVWNAAAPPYADPPGFTPGTFLSNLKAFVNVADNTSYEFPSFFVTSTAVTVNVHQAVQITISGKSDGEFTSPGQ